MKKLLTLIFLLCLFQTTPSYSLDSRTGWWYDPTALGQGLSIEVFNDSAVIGAYSLDSEGNPRFYLSLGDINSNSYTGKVYHWKNDHGAMSFSIIGEFTINFNDTSARVHFSSNEAYKPFKENYEVLKISSTLLGNAPVRENLQGWWITQEEPFGAIFIDASTSNCLTTWFYFNDKSEAEWRMNYGALPSTSHTFFAPSMKWKTGSQLKFDGATILHINSNKTVNLLHRSSNRTFVKLEL